MGIHAVTHPFSYNPMANTNGQEVGEFPYKWAIPWQGRVSEGVVITNPKELTTANLGPGAELVKINAEEHADFGRYFLAFDETSAKHQAARDCIREVSRQQWVGVAVPKDCDMEKGVDRSPELIEVEESSGLQNPGFFKRLATMMWGWGGACVLIGSICGFVFAMVTARSKWEYIIFVIIGAGAGFVPVMAISGSLYGDPLEAVKAPVSFPVVMTLAPDEEKEVGLVDLYRAESEGGFDQRVVVQICGSASAPNAQIVLASRQAHLGSGSLRLQRLASNGEIKRGEEPLTTGSVAVIRHNPEVPTGAKTVWVRSTRDSNASVTIAVGHPRELQGLCERAVPLPGVMGEVREEALHCLLDEAPNAALSPVTPETIAVSCSLVSAF
ncbi:MAG: hypothetical protein COW24_03360 [Candidatus Kerfeldbacteria bacterium CG15_BIG_FIL_POST_REV_8_21_14_020_45_12]|uniref:Uncharacterized protein n=1 Tax=Candidatus Kerfeldbacteria bacterium CG15_BIG_FIL_POST_REV_8_21_14_020_45_12 TaxID=2014247 RepID=A0A2M7H3L9_9BACT|nr:MAG: hypothetical protein COW24_03360 [Candidatus Kerfeldbacteria bacterium CG15_BIG_FIL_POST_REV_8_21_14_020_45_12]PJA92745.1 MAG: hypothetical protein CO132_06170 [Candidatus Kerfeldbacteria bacterium CG_4_9_14_3_um_filter_45_8]